jgi:hypothetical protein
VVHGDGRQSAWRRNGAECGLSITFVSWLVASSVPTLTAMVLAAVAAAAASWRQK